MGHRGLLELHPAVGGWRQGDTLVQSLSHLRCMFLDGVKKVDNLERTNVSSISESFTAIVAVFSTTINTIYIYIYNSLLLHMSISTICTILSVIMSVYRHFSVLTGYILCGGQLGALSPQPRGSDVGGWGRCCPGWWDIRPHNCLTLFFSAYIICLLISALFILYTLFILFIQYITLKVFNLVKNWTFLLVFVL